MALHHSKDGSPTYFHPGYGEFYHSKNGARSQAEEVFVGLSGIAELPEPRVLEVGFGLGLNFLASLRAVRQRGGTLWFWGLEPDPVPVERLEEFLAHCRLAPEGLEGLLAAWERGQDFVVAGDGYVLKVCFRPVERFEPVEGWADAVYYDPFSPGANPAAWSRENLARVRVALRVGGVLVSYAVAGWVRRALSELGFKVEKVPGGLGKREWLRAVRIS